MGHHYGYHHRGICAHQRVGTIGRQDRNVNGCRMVGHAEAAVLRFILWVVETHDARDGARYHAERVLEHHIVHHTP